MCKHIEWLIYSLEYSVDSICPDNKGGKKTRMLNTKMPLKEIIDMVRQASKVCECCNVEKETK